MRPEDLPTYIRKYTRIERFGNRIPAKDFLVVVLLFGSNKTDCDWEEQPAAKKWLKANGFEWDDGWFAWMKEVT